jgi:glycosyltransferase involved in cell wall biosynthesis
MRVVLTTHLFLPEFAGGTETLVHSIAAHLISKGHEALVVTGFEDKSASNQEAEFDEYVHEGVPVLRFRRCQNPPKHAFNPIRDDYDNRAFEARFIKLLADYRPDVVHFHHLGRLSIKAIDACQQADIPAFFTATDYWSICPHQALLLPNGAICDGPSTGSVNCLKHMVELTQSPRKAGIVNAMPNAALALGMTVLKQIPVELPGIAGVTQALAKRRGAIAQRQRLLRKIFVPTRHAQATLERNGISAKEFRVLPFGIQDYGYVQRVRQRGERLTLGYVGQFMAHKGLHVLMEALSLLPADSPVDIKVYAKRPAVDTDYVSEFFAAAQRDVRLQYCGTFENERFPQVLDALDVVVIPSIWHENMPLVSLSAQAAGCPLIASDVGGLSDIVANGSNGMLFEPGSAQQLRDCIMRLLTEDNLLYRLSSSAVTPGSVTQYVDALEQEYLQALGG